MRYSIDLNIDGGNCKHVRINDSNGVQIEISHENILFDGNADSWNTENEKRIKQFIADNNIQDANELKTRLEGIEL